MCTGAHSRIWMHEVKVEKGSEDIHIHFLSQSTEKCVEGVLYPAQKIVTQTGASHQKKQNVFSCSVIAS